MESHWENPECLICSDTAVKKKYEKVADRFNIRETYHIVSCNACGFSYLSPRPVENQMTAYYTDEGYQPHQVSGRSLTDKIYLLVRKWNLENKHKLIKKMQTPGNLLDIGCGSGEFLAKMSQEGWKGVGMETGNEARSLAKSSGVDVKESLEKIKGQFNLITMWHVLEHVHRVDDLFGHIHHVLEPTGILIIAVPNIDCIDSRFYKKNWAALDAPRHLYHFRLQDMYKLLDKNGFRLIKMSSLLYFDVWYNTLLSMQLSAKIKNQNVSFITLLQSFVIAKFSFLMGLIDIKKCSSPVYIATRK